MAALTGHPRRSAWVVLLAGAAALAAAWRLAAPATPPVYDGVLTPADPYRYLDPPPGINHPAPDALVKDLPLVDNQAPPIAETTDENPPQAQLLVQGGSFDQPPGTTGITVMITPVHPPRIAPAGGRLDGNVDEFAIRAGSTPLQLRSGSMATVVLRGPAGAGNATVEQFADGSWHRLDTQPVGNPDTWEANPTSLGDFALVVAATAGTPAGEGGGISGGVIAGIVGGGGVVVLVGMTAIVVRTRRPPPGPPTAARRSSPQRPTPGRRAPPTRPQRRR